MERLNLFDDHDDDLSRSLLTRRQFFEHDLVQEPTVEQLAINQDPEIDVFAEPLPSCSSWNGELRSMPSNISSLPSDSFPPTPLARDTANNSVAPNRRSSKRKQKPTSKAAFPTKRKKTKKIVIDYDWKKTQFRHRALIATDTFSAEVPENKTALEFFYDFFSEDIITDTVVNTNLYSVQQTGRSINITDEEFRDFLAIKLMMGIIDAPSYLDYWAARTRCPCIADVMPLKRYQQIRRFLHFVDNSDPNSDPYFKVRPLIEKIRKNCLKVEEENRFSIDEMTIPYKGTRAGKKKQYNPKKPNKWGFKNLIRAGSSGIIYDFFLYCGEDSFKHFDFEFDDDEMSLGWGGKAVIALCKTIQTKACVVYFDNYFTSLEVVKLLREKYGIFSLGTVRSNRLRGCDKVLPDDKTLKKKGRGASAQLVCNKNQLTVVKWFDNKCVTLVSSYVDSYPVGKIMRYDKREKKKVPVDFPQIVKEYNAHMGGVDLADMLIALYRTGMKTKRWYLSIFSQMIDICVNNAWLSYRRAKKGTGKHLSLKVFRLHISEGLQKYERVASQKVLVPVVTQKNRIAKPKRTRPVDDVRFDNIGHNQVGTSYGRCRFCKKGQTNVFCAKCEVRLCFIPNKRNCFYSFHTK